MVHAQQQPYVTVHIYPLSVNGQQGIAHLQAVLRLQRAALGKGGDGRVVESLCAAVQQQQDQKARQKIHDGAGGENQQLGPESLPVQGMGVVGVLVLALHGAETAAGDGSQGVECFALLLFPQGRPHADGKFVDGHAAGLGRQKVAQLMDGDQYAEDENGHKNIYDGRHRSQFLYRLSTALAASRARRSASSISARLG